jgi:hypothetical protein
VALKRVFSAIGLIVTRLCNRLAAEKANKLVLWRDRGCAVGVHDRQDSGIGRRMAVGSRNCRPVGRSQCIAQNTQNRVASTVTNVV